jgi:hypothetical protein
MLNIVELCMAFLDAFLDASGVRIYTQRIFIAFSSCTQGTLDSLDGRIRPGETPRLKTMMGDPSGSLLHRGR